MIFDSTMRSSSFLYRSLFPECHKLGWRAPLIVLMSSFLLASSVPAQDLGAELIEAARMGKLVRVRALLGIGTDPNLTDKDGWPLQTN